MTRRILQSRQALATLPAAEGRGAPKGQRGRRMMRACIIVPLRFVVRFACLRAHIHVRAHTRGEKDT
jgi:hypothetical protein